MTIAKATRKKPHHSFTHRLTITKVTAKKAEARIFGLIKFIGWECASHSSYCYCLWVHFNASIYYYTSSTTVAILHSKHNCNAYIEFTWHAIPWHGIVWCFNHQITLFFISCSFLLYNTPLTKRKVGRTIA